MGGNAPVYWLGQQDGAIQRRGVGRQGLTPQDEAGEVIKSGFERVEIEVSVTSQERWPVVIGMC